SPPSPRAPRPLLSFPPRRSSDLTSSPLASLVYNRPVAETTLVVHNWPADRVVALLRQREVLVEGSAGQPHTRSANGERCRRLATDRKSTRLNSSHDQISYAVFCL